MTSRDVITYGTAMFLLAGCCETPGSPAQPRFVGYQITKKLKAGKTCSVHYKHAYWNGSKVIQDRGTYQKSVCCCSYDSIKRGLHERLP